jgi:hypothetical protein
MGFFLEFRIDEAFKSFNARRELFLPGYGAPLMSPVGRRLLADKKATYQGTFND